MVMVFVVLNQINEKFSFSYSWCIVELNSFDCSDGNRNLKILGRLFGTDSWHKLFLKESIEETDFGKTELPI